MYSLSYHSDTARHIISPLFSHSALMYTDDCWTSSAYVFSLVKCQTVLAEMVLWTELPCVVHLCTFEAANWILQCRGPLFMSPSHSWVPVVKFESMSKSHDSWVLPLIYTRCVYDLVWLRWWVVRPMPSSNSHRMRLECGTVLDCWSTKTSEVPLVCLLKKFVHIAYKQNHKPKNELLIEIEE